METKCKETRVGMTDGNGINLCISSQLLPKLPDNFVGWIYRIKIDSISILHPYPCFLAFSSNGHPISHFPPDLKFKIANYIVSRFFHRIVRKLKF